MLTVSLLFFSIAQTNIMHKNFKTPYKPKHKNPKCTQNRTQIKKKLAPKKTQNKQKIYRTIHISLPCFYHVVLGFFIVICSYCWYSFSITLIVLFLIWSWGQLRLSGEYLLNNKNGSDGKYSQCARFWLNIIKGVLFRIWDLLQNSFVSGNIYRLGKNIRKSNLTHFTWC